MHGDEQPAFLADERGLMDRVNGPPTNELPVFLDLAGRPCLVVGSGRVAQRKISSLLACGAVVTVVSPDISPDLDVRSPQTLRLVRRPYQPADLDGIFLAVAATDDSMINRAVVADGRARGVLVGSVGPAGSADFTFGAVVQREGLTVAVSTGGRSPAFGRWLREEIERFLAPEYVDLLALAADVRAEQRRAGMTPDPSSWQACLTPELLELVRRGDAVEARTRLREALIPLEDRAC